VSAADLARLADELLADCPHREIEVLDTVPPADIDALVSAGYEHQPLVLMAREVSDDDGTSEPDPRVRDADEATVAPFVLEQWYRDMPAYGEATLRQLTDRRELLDNGSSVTRFAAEHDGVVVGSLDLVARGPVAELDALGVHPDHRGSGLGLSLMRAALAQAHRLGARVTILSALRDDWPREWYARLGFAEVSEVHEFTRITGITGITAPDLPADC
jgi:GNAT superfamily N-acetyltransferase